MKYLRPTLAAALALTFLAAAPALEYKIDQNHSTIGFAVPILGGLSKVRGKFTDFAITLKFDEADLAGSTIGATIKTASVDTGIAARNEHLRSADFFDVEKIPTLTFQSSRLDGKDGHYVMHGTLAMHGVSQEVALPFTTTGRKFGEGKKGKTVTAGFSLRCTLNRRDYGMTWEHSVDETFIADEIEIEIDVITKATLLAP